MPIKTKTLVPLYTVTRLDAAGSEEDSRTYASLVAARERASEIIEEVASERTSPIVENVDELTDAEVMDAHLQAWVDGGCLGRVLQVANEDGSHTLCVRRHNALDDDDIRKAALSSYLESQGDTVALDDIEETAYGEETYEAEGAEYRVLTDEEANEACAEEIAQGVWAFRPWFLADHMPGAITAEHVERLRGDSCEDINDAFVALIEAGSGMEKFVEAAIGADGRGHSLANYDHDEAEAEVGGVTFYVYRTN